MMDLTQLIKEPTRIVDNTRSLIDVILVNNEYRIIKSGVVPISLSDHFLIFCVLKAGVTKAQPRTMEYRSYRQFDANAFNRDLNNVPWNVVYNEENIDDALFTWNRLFSDIADEHAPIKRRRVKGISLPWMNSKLSEAMRDRDHHHRKAIKSNSTYHWGMYKRLRNFVNREIKSATSKYYCDLIEEADGDSSKIWKAVSDASRRGVNHRSESRPQCIISDGVQYSSPKSIASALNSYFASIGKMLADKIISVVISNDETVPRLPENYFQLNELDESTVLLQLLSLKPNKAIGLDKISARLLKCATHSICCSITRLLNLSIQSGKFPEIWKCSKVSALFKSGNRTNPSNYRPISILPTLSKILEKAMRSQLYEYLNSNNLLSDKQFGFRPKRSTVTALSSFTDEVLHNMEKGRFCGAVFLDLTKAFDTVDHDILLTKLSILGICPSTLQWFRSYLGNRKQRTSCDHELSDELPVTLGVPQGSVLGPLLFIIYIDSLPATVNHCEMSLYADDTVLYCYNTNLQELERQLNEDLLIIAKWLNEHKLTLNLDKTKSMLIGSNRKLGDIRSLSVSIFDYSITSVNNFKYLGVFLSSDLTWAHHVDYITSKINQRLGLLRRIRHLLPIRARLLFYNGLVLPLFDYADMVWGDKNNVTLMNNIQVLQNKAAKIIVDQALYSSASEALAKLNWITLERRRFYHRCIFIYKCINGYANHSMELLTYGDVHRYNTRNRDKLRLPQTIRNWGKQRMCYHAISDWNTLSKDIRNSLGIDAFKHKILNFLQPI